MRAAAIDAGTNTILFLAGERAADGRLKILADETEFARLGEGVDRTGRLSQAAIERGLSAFRRYASLAIDLTCTRIRATGTSALRDAANGGELLARVAGDTGIEVEIISGEREAALGFAAATEDLLGAGRSAVVLDVGGGSVQVICGRAGEPPAGKVSLGLGSVRLTERLVSHDPPTDAEVAVLRAGIRAGLAAKAPPPPPGPFELLGISGTCTSLALVARQYHREPPQLIRKLLAEAEIYLKWGLTEKALHHLQGIVERNPEEVEARRRLEEVSGRPCPREGPDDAPRVHGAYLQRGVIERMLSLFRKTGTSERARLPGLPPRRADVIIAGTLVVLETMERYQREFLMVSDRGIRHAILRDALSG